jgi:hypothetical protein
MHGEEQRRPELSALRVGITQIGLEHEARGAAGGVATPGKPEHELPQPAHPPIIPEGAPVHLSLRREPAIFWVSLVAPTVQAIAAFVFAADPDTQAIINTAAVAIAGAITAWIVRADNLLPALTGAAQAIIALVVGFGLDWTSAQQAQLMIPIGIIAGYIVRDRVVAPVPAVVQPEVVA